MALMAAVIILPAAHTFGHDIMVNTQDNDSGDLSITKASVDCDICDFQLVSGQELAAYTYDLYIPQKETVYSRSLAQTVHLFPNTLFSLRAPPHCVFT